MAKEDFCYTYYDGDAARDKAHMTRLERGAYDDIISAQRKRGRLSILDIRRVLGADFEACFPSMEWVLIKDENEKYFIEWVEKSIKSMQENSARNKKRIQDYWDKKKDEEDTGIIPRNNHGIKTELPLVDGDVNEDEDVTVLVKEDEFKSKKIIPLMWQTFIKYNPKYPGIYTNEVQSLANIAKYICQKEGLDFKRMVDYTPEIIPIWEKISKQIPKDPLHSKYQLSQIDKYIVAIIQSNNNEQFTRDTEKNGVGRTFIPDKL